MWSPALVCGYPVFCCKVTSLALGFTLGLTIRRRMSGTSSFARDKLTVLHSVRQYKTPRHVCSCGFRPADRFRGNGVVIRPERWGAQAAAGGGTHRQPLAIIPGQFHGRIGHARAQAQHLCMQVELLADAGVQIVTRINPWPDTTKAWAAQNPRRRPQLRWSTLATFFREETRLKHPPLSLTAPCVRD